MVLSALPSDCQSVPSSGCRESGIRNPPAWHRGLPGAEPPKESGKSPKGCPGASGSGEPQSPQRVRPGVRKESKKSPKLRFWTLFGLRGALFGDSGAPRGRGPRHTLSDSFRTLLGFRAQRAREPSVPGRGVPKSGTRHHGEGNSGTRQSPNLTA